MPDWTIQVPKRKRFEIFCDSETCLVIDPDYLDNDWFTDLSVKYQRVRDYSIVYPWLFAWKCPGIVTAKDCKTYERDYMVDGWELPDEEADEFFRLLSTVYNSLKKLPVIYFHNAMYDIPIVLTSWWRDLDPDIVIDVKLKANKDDLIAGRLYSPKYKFKALLSDTNRYKSISIKKIGEMYGMEKGEIPYTMANVEISKGLINYLDLTDKKPKSVPLSFALEYVKRDVDLMAVYHRDIVKLNKLLYKTVLGKQKKTDEITTIGGESKKLFDIWLRRHVGRPFNKIFIPPCEESEYDARIRSNMGGFTSRNRFYPSYCCKKGKKIMYIDINSSYPFIISSKLPYGDLLTEDLSGDCIKWVKLCVFSFNWRDSMSWSTKSGISLDRIQKRETWNKDYYYYLPECVFNFLIDNADFDYEIEGYYYQKTTSIGGEYIDHLFELRKQKKKEMQEVKKNSSEYELLDQLQIAIKTAMNTIYGKMCEKAYFTDERYFGQNRVKTVLPDEKLYYHSTLTGTYITWMSRLRVMEMCKELYSNGCEILYTDTDSVQFIYDYEDRKKIMEIVGNTDKLGGWKIEGEFDYFASNADKKYMLIDKDNIDNSLLKFSGINHLKDYARLFKEHLKVNFEECLNLWLSIFDPSKKWIFKNAKNISLKNNKYHTVIMSTNFNTKQNKNAPDGEIWLKDGGLSYEWRKAG